MIGQLLAGRYLILETLGVGGFSETYLARDKYLPYYPLCVVKRLQLPAESPLSLATAQQLFDREAQILGQLGQKHEQIPTLLAYCSEPDQVYLVQEYAEGENLTNWTSAGRRLTAAAAIAVLLDLLPVLAYIHRCHVIHHDIKPDNLIYRHRDSKLVLIDFGAAGLSVAPEAASGDSPAVGTLTIGTPGYMPNEQDDGRSQFNSDIYALGMLVIHLLTGVAPAKFQPDPITGELDWRRYLPDPTIAPDLLKIIDQMVRVAWRDRYANAADVIVALQSLSAQTNSRPQVIKQRWLPARQQFWRRARSMAKWPLVAGAIGSVYLFWHQGQTKNLWTRWQLWADRSDVQLQKLYEIRAPMQLEQMMIAPNDRLLVTAEAGQVLRVWSLNSGSRHQILAGATSPVTALSMSRDSQLLASGGQDGVVHLWNVNSGRLLHTMRGQRSPISALAISPDAKTVASGSQNGTVRLWHVADGTVAQTLTVPQAAITAVAYGHPDRLISASSARADPSLRQIQVWEQSTGKLQQTLTGHTAAIVGLQPLDAARLMSFGQDRTLLWNLQRQELAAVFPRDSARSIAAVWHNQRLVTVHDNGSIRAWTDQTGEPLAKQVGQLSPSRDAKLSTNQRYVVCWGVDHRLRVWQMNPTQIAKF